MLQIIGHHQSGNTANHRAMFLGIQANIKTMELYHRMKKVLKYSFSNNFILKNPSSHHIQCEAQHAGEKLNDTRHPPEVKIIQSMPSVQHCLPT